MRSLVDKFWIYGRRTKDAVQELMSCDFFAVFTGFWDDTKYWLDHCTWVDNP